MPAEPAPRRGAMLWGLVLGAAVLAIYAGFWMLATEPQACRDLARALPDDLASMPGRSCEVVEGPQVAARAQVVIPPEHLDEVAAHLTENYGSGPLDFTCCGDELHPAGQHDIPSGILPARDGARPALMLYLSVPHLNEDGTERAEDERPGILTIELVHV